MAFSLAVLVSLELTALVVMNQTFCQVVVGEKRLFCESLSLRAKGSLWKEVVASAYRGWPSALLPCLADLFWHDADYEMWFRQYPEKTFWQCSGEASASIHLQR